MAGGALIKSGLVNSLLLGCYSEGRLVCIGKAATGLSAADIGALTSFAKQLPELKPPFANPPRFRAGLYEKTVWVPPQLVVDVKFLEWTSDLTLRGPTILGFRDMPPEACVL